MHKANLNIQVHRCRFVRYLPAAIAAISCSTTKNPRVAIGRANGDIEIWNSQCVYLCTCRGGTGRAVETLLWVQNRLFSGGGSPTITEWDAATGVVLRQETSNPSSIWALCADSAGEKIAAACQDGSIVIFSVQNDSLEYLKTLHRSNAAVLSIDWLNSRIVAGCADGRIRIWDATSNQLLATMVSAKNSLVWTVKYLQHYIVSGNSSGAVQFWDPQLFSLVHSFSTSHEADVLCLAAVGEYKVFSAGVDLRMHMYTLDGSKWRRITGRRYHQHDVRAMAVLSSGFVITGGIDRTIAVIPIKDFPQNTHRMVPPVPQVNVVAIAPSSHQLLQWDDHSARLWKLHNGPKLILKMTLKDEENISHAAISTDGSLIAISTVKSTKLWHLTPGNRPTRLAEVSGARLVSISNSRNNLVLVTPQSQVQVYTLPQCQRIASFVPGKNTINKLALNSSFTHVAVSSICTNLSSTLSIIDIASSQISHTRLSDLATALHFSTDDTLTLTTSSNSILEFNLDCSLTPWTKRNQSNLPQQLLRLQDKPIGITCLHSIRWVWGATWLAYIDTSMDFAVQKRDFTGEKKGENKGWAITHKYRPMLACEFFSDGDLIVIERPQFDIMKELPPPFYRHEYGT